MLPRKNHNQTKKKKHHQKNDGVFKYFMIWFGADTRRKYNNLVHDCHTLV